jgi:molecular chaperone GrpE
VDSAASPALYREAVDALGAAGFTLIDPVGQQFDPTMHLAVARRATTDPRSHNRIAETVRPGCYGDGRLVREAEVVVYRTDASERQ